MPILLAGGPIGPLALITRRPGQDRKVAAKAGDSSAGMWLVGPPPVFAIQQVTANTPFRPLGNLLCVDESGVFKVNLWLSPHGIWYYRKVTTLPCGRRKEIQKSFHSRDKLVARSKVAQLLACARSRVKPESVQPEPQPNFLPEPQWLQQQTPSAANPAPKAVSETPSAISSPALSELSERYLKENALSWAPKVNRHNYPLRQSQFQSHICRTAIYLPKYELLLTGSLKYSILALYSVVLMLIQIVAFHFRLKHRLIHYVRSPTR